MDSYADFSTQPDVFWSSLILSVLLTLAVYAIFPMMFAWTRRKPIRQKTYKRYCVLSGITVVLIFLVAYIAMGTPQAPNWVAAALWTSVFYHAGLSSLRKNGLLEETVPSNGEKKKPSLMWEDVEDNAQAHSTQTAEKQERITFTEEPASAPGKTSRPGGEDGNGVNREPDRAPNFCRICGSRLQPDSLFCSNCGTKVSSEAPDHHEETQK